MFAGFFLHTGIFSMKIELKISTKQKNTRLDVMLSEQITDCSRSRIANLINDESILVNNHKKKPGYRTKEGDIITGSISLVDTEPIILPEQMDLDIQFEDDSIIVVNKPAGMVVHPAPGNKTGTLVNGLLFHYPKIKNVGDDLLRSGIVHRLDKDTSGLIVIAKTNDALVNLQNEFKLRNVNKQYLAIVSGKLSEREGKIELPIGRHPVKRKLMAVNHDTGKSALTFWKVVDQFESASYVEVVLKTGRTHQIRVHFYAIDHPLIGDQVYQPRRLRREKSIAQRQMLHSWKLGFYHPILNEKVSFEAPPPDDFNQVLLKLESPDTNN